MFADNTKMFLSYKDKSYSSLLPGDMSRTLLCYDEKIHHGN